MKQSKENIIIKAKQLMKEIDWGYDNSKELDPFFESKEKQILEYEDFKDHPNYKKVISQIKSYWTIGFDFEPEAEIEYNRIFLEIDDDTGEPFSIRHKQAIFKILKNSEGKYFTELNS